MLIRAINQTEAHQNDVNSLVVELAVEMLPAMACQLEAQALLKEHAYTRSYLVRAPWSSSHCGW